MEAMQEETRLETQGETTELASEAPELDEMTMKMGLERLRAEQRLLPGVAAGLAAALAGAAVWAVITVVTKFQIGWMAVGVGFLVAIALRKAGNGIDPVFSYAGAALALAGCFLGNLLAGCGFVAAQAELPVMQVIASLDAGSAVAISKAMFSPMDLLFYGIAAYEGFKLSLRPLTLAEIQAAGER